MKNLALIILSFAMIFSLSNCKSKMGANNQTNKDSLNVSENSTLTGKIEVIYFHNERRCATCIAVEEVTEISLKELYPEKMTNNEITFLSVNIEEETNKKIAEQYEVTGQTLLFISGDKKIDLTNDAFMYAKSTPEKFTEKIKQTIEKI
jgi:hypothetical protein